MAKFLNLCGSTRRHYTKFLVPKPGIGAPTLQLQQTKIVTSTDIMEISKRKSKALRAQATHLVDEAEALPRSTAPNVEDLEVVIERLLFTQRQLNEADTAIEPLIPKQKADAEFATVIEYDDKIVTCLARLEAAVKWSSDRNVGNMNSHTD